ncbi:MAG: alpha/beta hydrolase fold domain-containing protein [Caulobacterales bacterium]|jgi:monoterpene epsilon-lactone hydrolase
MTALPAAARKAALEAIFAHLAKPPQHTDVLAALRASAEGYSMGQKGRGVLECRPSEITLDGRPALWLTPPDARHDLRLLHLHGGGWVAGSIESHRALAAELAWLTRAPILVPSYRLAPEHPFPAGLEDAMGALHYVRSHGPAGSAPRAALGLSGDSAGGNLAAALALQCAAAGMTGPDRLALFSPFLSLSLGAQSFQAAARDPIVQQEGIDLVASLYAGAVDSRNPLVEPLSGLDPVLELMPPTLIQASAAESLRDQAFAFANRLWSVGVEARLSLWPDVPHVWHLFLETLPDARAALTEAAAFLSDFNVGSG